MLAKHLASSSSTWWCSVGQPVSWALSEPAWLAVFAASAAKPSWTKNHKDLHCRGDDRDDLGATTSGCV